MSHGEVKQLPTCIFPTVALGELIAALEEHARCDYEWQGKRTPVDVRFDFCWFVPGSFHSYRGFYDHLAITPLVSEDSSTPSITTFLDDLKATRGKTFTGWKGGEYRMDDDSPVWVDAPRNCSSTAIVGVSCNELTLTLHTTHVEV